MVIHYEHNDQNRKKNPTEKLFLRIQVNQNNLYRML